MTCSARIAFVAAILIAAPVNHAIAQQPKADGQRAERTMLEMTSPEFAAAVAQTQVILLPIGAIEQHGPHLPLASDVIGAVGQLQSVQRYVRRHGIETIVGPTLNVGITNEGGDATRDGTYMYPGSLTLPADTFVTLYVDLLRSLHDNGIRVVFLYSGHLGGRHLTAVARVVTIAVIVAGAVLISLRVPKVLKILNRH